MQMVMMVHDDTMAIIRPEVKYKLKRGGRF